MGSKEDLSKFVEEFRLQFADERNDFNKFWYEGHRFEYMPFVGYVHAPFSSKTLNINKQGFRGRDFVYKKASRDAPKRVAFFGASGLLGIPNTKDSGTIPELAKHYCLDNGLKIDALNFGLMCCTIKHELNLVLQILAEYDIDMAVLFSGYNDMHRAYSGEIWRSYKDVDDIISQAFMLNKKKDDALHHLKNAASALSMSVKKKFARIRNKDIAKSMKSNARKSYANIEVIPTYDITRKIYLEYLNQIIAAARYFDIPLLFSYQPSLYATKKPLSRYENAVAETDPDFGLYKNSKKEYDIEMFRKNYNLQRDGANALAKANGAAVADPEEHISKLGEDKDIFYDYCHLLEDGNKLVARLFAEKIIKTI